VNPITSFIIQPDPAPISPREGEENNTFIMLHNKYQFGDCIFENGDTTDFESAFKHHLAVVENCSITDIVYLPVYMYDHSGITINTTGFQNSWDSGQIGWIYVSKKDIRINYKVKRISSKLQEQVKSTLVNEIKLLDQYLTGDMYGFTIEHENTINSCWGFYGSKPETNGMWEHWTVEEILYYQEHKIEIT